VAAVDILGIANYAATVTVNSQSSYRRGEYFYKKLSIANSTPAYQSVTVSAVNGGSSSNRTGYVLLPASTGTLRALVPLTRNTRSRRRL
jgi:P pilus assembly chaperone PapD